MLEILERQFYISGCVIQSCWKYWNASSTFRDLLSSHAGNIGTLVLHFGMCYLVMLEILERQFYISGFVIQSCWKYWNASSTFRDVLSSHAGNIGTLVQHFGICYLVMLEILERQFYISGCVIQSCWKYWNASSTFRDLLSSLARNIGTLVLHFGMCYLVMLEILERQFYISGFVIQSCWKYWNASSTFRDVLSSHAGNIGTLVLHYGICYLVMLEILERQFYISGCVIQSCWKYWNASSTFRDVLSSHARNIGTLVLHFGICYLVMLEILERQFYISGCVIQSCWKYWNASSTFRDVLSSHAGNIGTLVLHFGMCYLVMLEILERQFYISGQWCYLVMLEILERQFYISGCVIQSCWKYWNASSTFRDSGVIQSCWKYWNASSTFRDVLSSHAGNIGTLVLHFGIMVLSSHAGNIGTLVLHFGIVVLSSHAGNIGTLVLHFGMCYLVMLEILERQFYISGQWCYLVMLEILERQFYISGQWCYLVMLEILERQFYISGCVIQSCWKYWNASSTFRDLLSSHAGNIGTLVLHFGIVVLSSHAGNIGTLVLHFGMCYLVMLEILERQFYISGQWCYLVMLEILERQFYISGCVIQSCWKYWNACSTLRDSGVIQSCQKYWNASSTFRDSGVIQSCCIV